jgi:hypothetical protein
MELSDRTESNLGKYRNKDAETKREMDKMRCNENVIT